MSNLTLRKLPTRKQSILIAIRHLIAIRMVKMTKICIAILDVRGTSTGGR